MWVRKTPEELKKSYCIKAINIASFWSIALMFFIGILVKTGYQKYAARSYNPISWDCFIGKVPVIFILGMITFVVIFLRYRNRRINNQRMCIYCEEIINDRKVRCECGGEVYFISDLKWLEESEEAKAKNQ
jgi:cell division protein FtsW (lipid II flippase)